MFTDDTIVAIATPPGRGGIGVVRVSGPGAIGIARALTRREGFEPRHATLATVVAQDGSPVDQAVVTCFPAPHSYTGEDVVELSAHGSPIVLQAIVAAAMAAGARLANPGEFTFRAYIHGRIDLVQAEAVAELIEAVTPLQARIAIDQLDGTLSDRLRELDGKLLDIIAPLEASLDFPDEGYHFIAADGADAAIRDALTAIDTLLAVAARGRIIREGRTVTIVGRPNAGKSSLFNRLVGAARAIVTDVPGTTRDLVTERVDVGGVPFTFVDTAGLREGVADAIEEEGIARARQAAAAADIRIVVLDRSRALDTDDRALMQAPGEQVVVANKSDLPPAWEAGALGAIPISSLTGDGIDAVRDALLADALGADDAERDRPAVANLRQVALLEGARSALAAAGSLTQTRAPEELVLVELYNARSLFDEITGARPQDEVLQTIFSRFCIGK